MATIKKLPTKVLMLAACLIIGMISSSFANAMIWEKTPTTSPIHEFSGIHEFTFLPLTEGGWTDFRYMIREQNLYQDARVVFISSSDGNDVTGQVYGVDNLTFDQYGIFQPTGPINAYASLSSGASQLRDGYPDIMLLKRGDEWIETLPYGGRSGRSKTERAIYATYGTEAARPTLRPLGRIISSANNWHNVILTGFRVYGAHRDPDHPSYQDSGQSSSGIRLIGHGMSNLLLEDVHIEFGRIESHIYGGEEPLVNFAMRRCFHEKFYTLADDHAGNLLINDWNGLLIEESIQYHGGWRSDKPEDVTIFRRNIYQHSSIKNNIYRYNFSFMGATEDQFRSGGNLIGNVWARMPNGPAWKGNGDVAYNVTLEATDNVNGKGYSGGTFELEQLNENNHFYENITANGIGNSARPVTLNRSDGGLYERNIITNHGNQSLAVGELTTNIHLVDNVLDNQRTDSSNHHLILSSGGSAATFAESRDNKFYSLLPADRWMNWGGSLMTLANWKTAVGDTTSVAAIPDFPDPTRSLATYNASLGFEESFDAFVVELRKQSRANWREEYMARPVVNYIRAGFGRGPIPEDY